MGANIDFEAAVPTTKKFFLQSMTEFINLLELNDQKYQTNRTVMRKIIREIYYLP